MQRSYGPRSSNESNGCAVTASGKSRKYVLYADCRSARALRRHRRKPAVRRIDDQRRLIGRSAALAPVRRGTNPRAARALRVDDRLGVGFGLARALGLPFRELLGRQRRALAELRRPLVWRALHVVGGPEALQIRIAPGCAGNRPGLAAAGRGGVRRAAGLSRRVRLANRQRAEKRGGEDDSVAVSWADCSTRACVVSINRLVYDGPDFTPGRQVAVSRIFIAATVTLAASFSPALLAQWPRQIVSNVPKNGRWQGQPRRAHAQNG